MARSALEGVLSLPQSPDFIWDIGGSLVIVLGGKVGIEAGDQMVLDPLTVLVWVGGPIRLLECLTSIGNDLLALVRGQLGSVKYWSPQFPPATSPTELSLNAQHGEPVVLIGAAVVEVCTDLATGSIHHCTTPNKDIVDPCFHSCRVAIRVRIATM